MNRTYYLVALTAATLVAGCDALVDGGHRGEPLARINLSVQDVRSRSNPGVDVVVLWGNHEGSPDIGSAESVSVEGAFPAQFQLAVYEPPDSELRFGGGPNLGIATIVAIPQGTDTSRSNTIYNRAIGVEKSHVLVWASGELPADSNWPYLLHSAPTAGFHIYDVSRFDEAERARRLACIDGLTGPSWEMYTVCGGSPFWDDLRPASTDLDTVLSIDLVDSVSREDIPNWN